MPVATAAGASVAGEPQRCRPVLRRVGRLRLRTKRARDLGFIAVHGHARTACPDVRSGQKRSWPAVTQAAVELRSGEGRI